MARNPVARGRLGLMLAALTVLTCTIAVPSIRAQEAPAVATTVSDVEGVSLTAPEGAPRSKAMVAYTARQQSSADLAAGTVLPGAVVDRATNAAAYEGLWGGTGFLAGWMAPTGSQGAFEPEADLVESSRFRNRLKPNAGTIPGGSSWPFAMAQLGWDSPTPFDRAPSATPGHLSYETAVETRQITTRHGGKLATLDVAFFRADLVARGGDVDARSGFVYGPMIVDLGRPFTGSAASYSGAAATLAVSYIGGFNMAIAPSAGKVAIYANLKGMIREAREYTLPSGVTVNEWHLPVMGVVVSGPIETDELAARFELELGPDALEVPLSTAPASFIDLTSPPTFRRPTGPALGHGEVPDPLPATVAEIRDTSPIDASLSEPVEVSLGNGNWSVRVDPDFRDEGVLAVEGVRRTGTGPPLVDVMSVPFVETESGAVKLDRSRLRDLRVMPVMPDGRWYLQASGGSSLFQSMNGRILDHHGLWPALQIEAVYDIGGGLEAHVMYTARQPMPSPHLGRAVSAGVLVRSLTGARRPARPIHYLELPGAEPVVYDGEVRSSEFAGPLDLAGTHMLSAGALTVSPSYARPGFEARATVVRAPAPLTPTPTATPGRSLQGHRTAVYVTAPDDLPFASAPVLPAVQGGYGPWAAAATSSGWIEASRELPRDTVAFSFTRVERPSSPGTASPKPIGTPCGTPQVSDLDLDDADAVHDVRSAWLDADQANLYATIHVRQVPAASASSLQTYDYVFQWRHEHIGYYARASLDSSGVWKFDFGYAQSSDFFKVADVAGEVKSGTDGLIRVAVPRTLFDVPDGQPLRFASVWAQETQGASSPTRDHAPHTSTYRGYGDGLDYSMGRC